MKLYPWLEQPYMRLINRGSQLPHAILLTGSQGIGKLLLAQEVAHSLLCPQQINSRACNRCSSCHLFSRGNHPDYHLLTSEKQKAEGDVNSYASAARYLDKLVIQGGNKTSPKRVVGVEQIRMLTQELGSTSHLGRGKVVVICPADHLNLNAANALLKVLEEPTNDTYFLLVTAFPYRLPATVRSRCSYFRVQTPDADSGLTWLVSKCNIDPETAGNLLQLTEGSPIRANEIQNTEEGDLYAMLTRDLRAIVAGQESIGNILNSWRQRDIRAIISWLQRQMMEAIRSGLRVDAADSSKRLFVYLGHRQCFGIYEDLGIVLQWPSKTIDESLFLESVVTRLFEPVIEPG